MAEPSRDQPELNRILARFMRALPGEARGLDLCGRQQAKRFLDVRNFRHAILAAKTKYIVARQLQSAIVQQGARLSLERPSRPTDAARVDMMVSP